jgi:hypothetical protein
MITSFSDIKRLMGAGLVTSAFINPPGRAASGVTVVFGQIQWLR